MTKKSLNAFTPEEIVEKLDCHIVGQADAKRAVAIALRNRWRRKQIEDIDMRDEITPKNIIMSGSTGVGKTEIARRLAKLSEAPFLKIEATSFTEVGYVGKNVESMIKDLVENSIRLVRDRAIKVIEAKVEGQIEQRLIELLIDQGQIKDQKHLENIIKKGNLDECRVEITVQSNNNPMMQMFSQDGGVDEMKLNMEGVLPKPKPKVKKVKVSKAKKILLQEEINKRLDDDEIVFEALEQAEQNGIIFIDEIDKVAGSRMNNGPDVSRQGVQRDLLPIVEGCTIATKYGMIDTKHILFIAAGAFNVSKPSDLIPEFQGRFPISAELHDLGRAEFIRILTEPKHSLVKQYIALMKTEKIKLEYDQTAIERIADIAVEVNNTCENIGARRLHTIMEKIVEELSFDAPNRKGSFMQFTEDTVDIALRKMLTKLGIEVAPLPKNTMWPSADTYSA